MTDEMTAASVDAIELLVSQHREVDTLWTQVQMLHREGSEAQATPAQEIVTKLSGHDAIETQFLYPELRKLDDAGSELADHSLEEHQRIRELLREVDGRDPRDESVYVTLSQAISGVMAHVQEEETQIFPLLRQRLDEGRLTELGEKMRSAMKLAPTHPHPSTPNNKLGATVAGAVAGVVDRARDAVTGGTPDR
jgi:hemerythrin superfamily protein